MENKLSITLKNDMNEVIRLADVIDEFCGAHSIVPFMTYEINLAFDEIVSNIIEHGFADKQKHEITIDIELVNDNFTAKVEDDGVEFNPLNPSRDERNANLEERSEGGLGIHIIKKYIEDVRYERMDDKNCLTLSKKISFAAPN